VALLTVAVRGEEVSPATADRALSQIPPGAAVWAWRPWTVPSLVHFAAARAEDVRPTARIGEGQDAAGRRELAGRRAATYLDRVIEAHPDTIVRPQLLLGAMSLADAAGRQDDAVAYYDRLLEAHPGSQAARAAQRDPPGERLRMGSPVPDVPLPALDSTAPAITELAGPATLVDFWAAWCTPCVAEMPGIHAAWERFRDRGFDVVSVSYDAGRDDVARFREHFPMPWRHSFVGVEALSDGEVAAAWGVTGLPAAYLVGPDGTIIALESELRGEALMETLERVLGE
jgi:peroxiredoxin